MVISINHLTKKFKSNEIFKDFNLTIKKNEITSIYGKSGKGKSTLLNIIGLLETFDSGEITLFNQPLPKINSKKAMLLKRNKISYLFQNYALIEDQSINKNLEIALEYRKELTTGKKQELKLEILERVGLNKELTQKIYSLSGGEKQRVALARCLLKPNELILADEPTGSLDEENARQIIKILEKERENNQKSILIVTHDPAIAQSSDKIIKL